MLQESIPRSAGGPLRWLEVRRSAPRFEPSQTPAEPTLEDQQERKTLWRDCGAGAASWLLPGPRNPRQFGGALRGAFPSSVHCAAPAQAGGPGGRAPGARGDGSLRRRHGHGVAGARRQRSARAEEDARARRVGTRSAGKLRPGLRRRRGTARRRHRGEPSVPM